MTGRAPVRRRLGQGLGDLARDFDLVLCDVWGVLHNGVRHHATAVDALQQFRRSGGTVILITNAPVPKAQVARRLASLHVPGDAYDSIATSGDVTVDMIVEAGCPPLFGIGPAEESQLYAEAGRRGPRVPPLVAAADAGLAVCIGLDGTGDEPSDYDGVLASLRSRDLRMICANPDLVVEVGDELVYCAGAIAARYAAIGGTVVQAGKPFAPIYELALRLAERLRGATARDRILAVGDAIATDIQGAARQGFASLFVSSGIHRGALHPTGRGSPIDTAALDELLAGEGVQPFAVAEHLAWNG